MLPQSSQQQAEWRYPQPSRRPLPQGHGIPRHGPYGQGAQGLRRRHRGTASPSTPGESPTSTWEHTRPRWATSTPCWGSTPTTPRRSAGQGRRPGQPGPLRRGGRGLRPVPGARPRQRRGPRGQGAGPHSLERHELAIEDYSRVLDTDPRNRDVLYSRGIARLYAARFESAIEDFDAIIGIEPGHAAARGARELAREALGMQGGAG